jgi:D-proline reductase (dithiol) PrdB
MTTENKPESLSEFKNSFAYGTRTDLNFKFLKNLPDEEAARFFQDLLWALSDAFDSDRLEPLRAYVQQAQAGAYAGPGQWRYDDAPFTPLPRPLSECRLGLLSSGGQFVAGDDPEPFGVKEMTQAEAMTRTITFLKSEPVLSRIPVATPGEKLRVRHGGYDIRAAQTDHNVVLPLERLRELAAEGAIGELVPTAYSFVGMCAQTRLLKESAPAWIRAFQEAGIEAMLMVPV